MDNNWFTIEQIDRDTFSISEYKHWEETHCYLLCGEKYDILIDTGLGVSNISRIVDSLTKLPVMTVTTHVHWDHIGGHKYFDNIAVHEAEKDWLSVRFPIPLQVVKNNLTRLAGLKEIVPVIRDRQTREIVASTIRKLDAIPEPECRRFIADTKQQFIQKRDNSIRRRLAEAKAQARTEKPHPKRKEPDRERS